MARRSELADDAQFKRGDAASYDALAESYDRFEVMQRWCAACLRLPH